VADWTFDVNNGEQTSIDGGVGYYTTPWYTFVFFAGNTFLHKTKRKLILPVRLEK
jgi:hypothetical protein